MHKTGEANSSGSLTPTYQSTRYHMQDTCQNRRFKNVATQGFHWSPTLLIQCASIDGIDYCYFSEINELYQNAH